MWILAGALLVAMFLLHPLLWGLAAPALWPPYLGLALVLTYWLGPWGAGLAAGAVFLARLLAGGRDPLLTAAVDAALTGAELVLGWWWYVYLARGSRRLDDPTSATLFLLLVPVAAVGLGAVGRTLLTPGTAGPSLTQVWVTDSLSALALAPPLLLALTPWARRVGLARPVPQDRADEAWPESWSAGEAVEAGGLAVGAAILGMLLASRPTHSSAGDWLWWGILLLVIVWAGLRQGLRGSAPAASAAAVAALLTTALGPVQEEHLLLPLQGNLLALASTALLIGASTGWIRANELRYRQVVGHIPVVLYSARFVRAPAPNVTPVARVTFVGPASREVLGHAPPELLGDYQRWLALIHPSDREVALAAVAQLCRQNQPVTCEYRLASPVPAPGPEPLLQDRWVRDALSPRHDEAGRLEGWDGVMEDVTERRTLSYSLRRTTTMLHALVANLPAGVMFVQGEPGRLILVNARARQLLGQREDLAADITHLSQVFRLHRPDGTPYPWEELPLAQALRRGMTSMRDDIVVHRSDGRRIPLVAWGAPVSLEETDRHDSAVWVFEDLTALHQAEAAHQEAEARLRAVIATMAEGLIVQDESGAVVDWNPAACTILGVSPAEMAGRAVLGPDPACLREDGSPCPRDEQPDRACLRTGAPVRNVILGIPAPDGLPVRWILANAMPLPRRGKPGAATVQVVITFADITAYRQALNVVRASEEKYRGLVEALPLVLVQMNAAGRITYGNPAARALLGGAEPGPDGQQFWKALAHPEDWRAVQQMLTDVLRGQPARAEFRFQAGGAERCGYALATPLWQDGEVAGSTLLVVDLTAQRRLEQQLGRVQRLDLMGRLAGGIVHDFNNLLSVAVGLTLQVRQGLCPGHAAGEDLRRVQEALEQAGRLAGQLLTFSKQRRVELRPVLLDAVVRRTLDLLRSSLPPAVTVEPDLAAGGVEILADEGQFQQVLMNLCLNARDAMPAGGRLTVQTSPDGRPATAAASPNGSAAGPWVRLTVQDTGVGMEPEVQARIFEPFFTTKERGTGLGLAVVRQLIESFAGQVEVSSVPGQGTRFDVWLPQLVTG
jgi:PAS domain S-box-containing protein